MIWTIVCFLIALFVLKRYAFGPIQGAIDKRRERIRESIEEADRAREEARKLLEEHRKLDRPGQVRRGGDPRRGPQAGRRPARARPRGDRGRPAAAPRGHEEADRRGDPAGARPDPHRGRRADARRDREGDRQGARPRRPAEADRGRDRRPRLLGPGAERARASMSRRPPHLRARALRRGAEAGRLAAVRQDLGDFVEATRPCPSSARSSATRSSTSARRRPPSRRSRARRDPLVAQLPAPARREGARPATSPRCAEEFERLAAAEEGELTVELTTAFELSDEEARAIVGQIEQRSGRKVEASRTVDPALIGGMVLQVGSRRVDASVRGRIEQLGRELRTGA